eukprot:Nitzschia sp. Nitz4//scaffold315_size20666//2786//3223//NITZ4_008640-RA/size20666-processed-gene-0.1-mRNA-1//1//CDS//3329547483//6331//frame0
MTVSFGDVTIMEFPVVLSENPAVSSGAPIEIGWRPKYVHTEQVEVYDFLKESQRKPTTASSRRVKTLSVPKRAQLLMSAGYSIDEIAEAVLRVENAQKQRAETARSGGLSDRMQEIIQNTGKIPMNVVRGMFSLGKPTPKIARSA